jgi:hypothetical protein
MKTRLLLVLALVLMMSLAGVSRAQDLSGQL